MLLNLLQSYDDINIFIKKLINKEIVPQQINNVLSDFFNKICEYFEQKLSKDSDNEKALLALIKNPLQGSGSQGQSKLHQYISNRLLSGSESADKLPEYLKKLSDYLMSLACDYELGNIVSAKLGVKVNYYLGSSELQCFDGEIIRLEQIRGQDNLYEKAFKGLIDEFIVHNPLPSDGIGLQIHMKEFLCHTLEKTSDTHAITPAQYLDSNEIIKFFNEFGVKFYEKLKEALIDEITDIYKLRISQSIAIDSNMSEDKAGEEEIKHTSYSAITKKVQEYCPNIESALAIFDAIIAQDDGIIESLKVTDANEARDTRSNAEKIIKQAIDSTKEERISNQFEDDPITQQEKYKSYLRINPFENLGTSSISHEEVKELVKLFKDDQQDSGQVAGDKLSKEEKEN